MAKYADGNVLSHAFTVIKNWVTTNFAAISHTHAVSDITNAVTGVKGNSETDYRTGNVNLTAANVGAATSSHSHGDITNGGDITASAPTVASGDKLIINDESASKITNGPSFGSDTTKYLRNDGTWAVPPDNGEVNQNAFSTVTVNAVDINATSKTDAIKLIGSNVTLTPDATSGSVTFGITATDVTTALGTTSVARATANSSGTTFGDAAVKAVDTSISSTTSTNLPTSAAVATYVSTVLSDVAGALVYQGTAATAAAISGSSYKKGWYWIASASFTLWTNGPTVEAGDMIIAKQDKTATFSNDIDVVQTNIESLTTAEIDALWAAA